MKQGDLRQLMRVSTKRKVNFVSGELFFFCLHLAEILSFPNQDKKIKYR